MPVHICMQQVTNQRISLQLLVHIVSPDYCIQSILYTHTHVMGYLCVLNGRFCQEQMPEYKTVCKKPSADLSDT